MAIPRKPDKPLNVQQMTAYPGPTVTVGGDVYRLGFNTQDAKGRLEELVRAHVWERVYAESGKMKPATAKQHEDRYEKKFDAGHYDTFGAGWQATIQSPSGAVLFLLSLLQEHHPELTPADAQSLFAAEQDKFRRAVGVVAPDFFAAVLRQFDVPEDDIAARLPELKALAAAWLGTPAPDTAST